MPILILEERAVNAVIDFLKERLPIYLARIQTENPGILLPMFSAIDDEYIDPSEVRRYPCACVFVDESKDKTKDRAMDENTCSLRVMSLYDGAKGTKKTYRYNAAIREAVQEDRSLGGRGCRAVVVERIYYTPINKGNQEVRVAESYLEVTMEVQRR
jgi:hypothetical protein